MSFFKFLRSNIGSAITGTSDMALQRPRPPAIDSIYGPAYNVRGSLAMTRPGGVVLNNRVVIVGITGNGAYLNNSPQLVPLAREESQ